MGARATAKITARGFTLVELLIVAVIIAILAAITMAVYNGVEGRSRDARRLADMQTIQQALQMYKALNGAFPAVNYDPGPSDSGWESSALEAPGQFIAPLSAANGGPLDGVVPVDPVNDNTAGYRYLYFVYPAGQNGCDPSKGDYYVIGITRTDTYGTAKDPSSPDFVCSGRDWQTEFSWVAGAYTNS